MEENKNYTEPEENGVAEPREADEPKVEEAEQSTAKEGEQSNVEEADSVKKETDNSEKPQEGERKRNFKAFAIVFAVGVVLVATLIALIAGGNKTPEVTTPLESDPAESTSETTVQTTPQTTTPAGPTETVTYPSNEDDDPKQEDVFFD